MEERIVSSNLRWMIDGVMADWKHTKVPAWWCAQCFQARPTKFFPFLIIDAYGERLCSGGARHNHGCGGTINRALKPPMDDRWCDSGLEAHQSFCKMNSAVLPSSPYEFFLILITDANPARAGLRTAMPPVRNIKLFSA